MEKKIYNDKTKSILKSNANTILKPMVEKKEATKTTNEIGRVKNLFGDEIIRMKSFTNDKIIYEIDQKKKTCTCPHFQNRGVLCKHLMQVLEIESPFHNLKFNKKPAPVKERRGTSLLKSSTQKAIRRGDIKRAVVSAKAWIEIDHIDFLRRMAIVSVEEAVLHPKYYLITDRLKTVTKTTELSKDFKEEMMNLVADMAKCDYREYWDTEHSELGEFTEYTKLEDDENRLVEALEYRSNIGGMQGDMRMMKFFAKLWRNRFEKKWVAKDLNKYFKFHKIDYDEIGKMTKDDFMVEAVDFHCSPLLNILKKKEYILNLLRASFPKDDIELRLKDLVWRNRSGINYKKTVSTNEEFIWLDFENEKPYTYKKEYKEDYQRIYKLIEDEINNISKWFINQQKI